MLDDDDDDLGVVVGLGLGKLIVAVTSLLCGMGVSHAAHILSEDLFNNVQRGHFHSEGDEVLKFWLERACVGVEKRKNGNKKKKHKKKQKRGNELCHGICYLSVSS